jgi:hypothetical protein
MTETTEWGQWRGSWQTRAPTSEELDGAMTRFERAMRRYRVMRVAEWAIVVLAVVFPLLAIRHAADAVEATLGIGAAVIVLSVAVFRSWNRHAERVALGTSAREFDEAVRTVRYVELRFTRFLWLVLGVEGVFAAVWWYGGLEVHHGILTSIAVWMLWVPLAVVVVTLAWSVRLRARAKRELAALAVRDRDDALASPSAPNASR